MLARTLTLSLLLLATPLAPPHQDSRPAAPPNPTDARALEFPPPSPLGLGRGRTEEDLRELLQLWPKLLEDSAEHERSMQEFRERFTPASQPDSPASQPAKPDARLPRAPLHETMWFTQLGEVVQYAQPLWKSKTWSADELARAELIDQYLRLLDGAPRMQCRAGAIEQNNKQVDALVRWYWECIDTPATFAKMIFTMDEGPFVGVALEPSAGLRSVAMRELGESMTLELCSRENEAEPFAFRLWRDEKVEWVRVISDSPECTVRHAEFTGDPRDGGVYGWFVPFAVKWSAGHERASLYLGPKGEFRFYFMSW
ncbi:MAG: hypothetical protein EPO68_09165 [Planctomycetota bacterium]|nr:MAG: hypothetical protein EPO68_09165 [Planctomycetota bacterium]